MHVQTDIINTFLSVHFKWLQKHTYKAWAHWQLDCICTALLCMEKSRKQVERENHGLEEINSSKVVIRYEKYYPDMIIMMMYKGDWSKAITSFK